MPCHPQADAGSRHLQRVQGGPLQDGHDDGRAGAGLGAAHRRRKDGHLDLDGDPALLGKLTEGTLDLADGGSSRTPPSSVPPRAWRSSDAEGARKAAPRQQGLGG